ncbi:MAG: acyl-CoA dehydrogenase family protein [Chloroflexi bacterium]|nr:acyl-CoA dehydrogenase family protein [Chloroflexota bacterium]
MSDMLLTEDELLLKNMVRELADQELAPRAAAYDESAEFPWDNVRRIAEMGLFGLTIDEKYGGSGGTNRQLAIVVEEIARGCAATSVIYIAHLSLCTQFIHMFGTEAQKQQFIPPLAKGEKMGAFALTEPGSGSDSGAMRTTSTKSDGEYKLNGSKLFITNATEADTFVVMASHDRSLRTRGIDAFIVERDSAGFSVNPQGGKMGMRASTTSELVFEDCPVPEENRLGDEGEGFRETMAVLNASRIGIAAQCVGIAQAAYEAAVSYAKQREAFGQHLADFQGIQWMIAEMATNIEAARLLVHRAATLLDNGLPFVTEASMAKLFASRIAVDSADKAVQIHGGAGYFAPMPVERYFRDAKVTEIYEGTSEIQRLIIARNILQADSAR